MNSRPVGNFVGYMIAMLIGSFFLVILMCELTCNMFGYTIQMPTVGPANSMSEPTDEEDEVAWKCAGFRRLESGEWGYSGQFDQEACRQLRDMCASDSTGCDDWQKIQEGKIGWGEDNITLITPLDVPYKHIDMRLLVGDETEQQQE